MVVLSKTTVDQISLINNHKPVFFSRIPSIDLSKPDTKSLLVEACEEFGFFRVINHGIPMELIDRLEAEAVKFFSLPQDEKDQAAPANHLGYGNMRIGSCGDIGWVEYLLMPNNEESISQLSLHISNDNPEIFCSAANHYISSVKSLACQVLELLAEGLNIHPRDIFSNLLMDEKSDEIFRINHYPPCPGRQAFGGNLTGFGEHTDPQIISVLRSNNSSGLEISLKDGTWVGVPTEKDSFYVIVGDSMQVMTNGRLKSVKHRVLAGSMESRVSMIYFGAPALKERIAAPAAVLKEGEESLYQEFTWLEYKNSAFNTRLADNRLELFERKGELIN